MVNSECIFRFCFSVYSRLRHLIQCRTCGRVHYKTKRNSLFCVVKFVRARVNDRECYRTRRRRDENDQQKTLFFRSLQREYFRLSSQLSHLSDNNIHICVPKVERRMSFVLFGLHFSLRNVGVSL